MARWDGNVLVRYATANVRPTMTSSLPGHGDYLCWGGKCYESHYHGYENQTECEATCKHKAADLSSPYQLAGEYDFAAAAASANTK